MLRTLLFVLLTAVFIALPQEASSLISLTTPPQPTVMAKFESWAEAVGFKDPSKLTDEQIEDGKCQTATCAGVGGVAAMVGVVPCVVVGPGCGASCWAWSMVGGSMAVLGALTFPMCQHLRYMDEGVKRKIKYKRAKKKHVKDLEAKVKEQAAIIERGEKSALLKKNDSKN